MDRRPKRPPEQPRFLHLLVAGTARLGAVLAIGLAAAIFAPSVIGQNEGEITSNGPLTRIIVTRDLNCQVAHEADSFFEFFGTEVGACGTFLAVAGALYGPAFNTPSGQIVSDPWNGDDCRGTATAHDSTGARAAPHCTPSGAGVGDPPIHRTDAQRKRRSSRCPDPGRAASESWLDAFLETPDGRRRPLPIERIVAGQGIRLVRSPLESDDDVSGFYQNQSGREIIGVNSLHPPVRQRFTIAHELGHAVLHAREGLHLDQAFKLRFRDATSSLAVDPEEMDANRFAAELLMPAEEVIGLLEGGLDVNDDQAVRQIARHFGVSQQAMTYRIVNLGAELDGAARFG